MFPGLRTWYRKRKLSPSLREKILKVEQIIGYKVQNPTLYLKALRHRSKLIESNLRHNESYEQLEFLGDAVLDLIVTEIIFEKFPFKNEGFMTQMRSRIVKGETLAMLSNQLGLSEVIEVGERVKDQGIESSTSVLADIFEAILGAVYRDLGYPKARKFVTELIEMHIDFDKLESEKDNFKSSLLEFVQSRRMPSPVYKVNSITGPDHDRTFEIQVYINEKGYGYGEGKNKKKAEQIAAKLTLDMLLRELKT